jgi:hypothetical protein
MTVGAEVAADAKENAKQSVAATAHAARKVILCMKVPFI